MISSADRYFIERKYHDPEKAFDPFKHRAYYGIGCIDSGGLREQALPEGLEKKEKEISDLPHPAQETLPSAMLWSNMSKKEQGAYILRVENIQ